MLSALRLKILFTVFFIGFSVSSVMAEVEDTFAYKLAVLHIKNEYPQKVLLEGKIEPPTSVIYEFQWILDGMKNRCNNTEEEIASTIVNTWVSVRPHKDINILETARALSLTARNQSLFGTEKVNFRLTSKYWLAQQISP